MVEGAGGLGQQTFGDGEDPGKDAEEEDLQSHHLAHGAYQHGIGVKTKRAHLPGSHLQAGAEGSSCQEKQDPGYQEEPGGAVKQHEAQMPPAIPPTSQMGRPGAPVLIEGDGDFPDAQAL